MLYWGGSGARKGMYGVLVHLITLGGLQPRLAPAAFDISACNYYTTAMLRMQGFCRGELRSPVVYGFFGGFLAGLLTGHNGRTQFAPTK